MKMGYRIVKKIVALATVAGIFLVIYAGVHFYQSGSKQNTGGGVLSSNPSNRNRPAVKAFSGMLAASSGRIWSNADLVLSKSFRPWQHTLPGWQGQFDLSRGQESIKNWLVFTGETSEMTFTSGGHCISVRGPKDHGYYVFPITSVEKMTRSGRLDKFFSLAPTWVGVGTGTGTLAVNFPGDISFLRTGLTRAEVLKHLGPPQIAYLKFSLDGRDLEGGCEIERYSLAGPRVDIYFPYGPPGHLLIRYGHGETVTAVSGNYTNQKTGDVHVEIP